MKQSDLNILLREGEGTMLEFKENLSASFARELVAMANTIGGKILLGVRNDGMVVSITDSNSLRARIQDIARNCDPPVLVHQGANVFVEIYTDRIEVVSPGGLPKGMTLADLGSKSVRRNALIADLLHRIDFIEKAGTGIRRIREEARTGGYPEPGFEANGFVTAIFRPNPGVRARVAVQSMGEVGTKSALSQHQVEILRNCQSDKTLVELMAVAGRSDRTKFRHQVLNLLLERGLLEMTIPDKPRSSKQRYHLTPLGMEYPKKIEETK